MKTRSTTEACRPWRDRLLDALDAERTGQAGAALPEALAAHLSSCPGCASELAALRLTLARLAAHQPGEPPVDYWPALRARVHYALAAETQAAPRRSALLPRVAWGSLAAAALVLLALAWWNGRAPEAPGGQSPRLAEGQAGLSILSEMLAANAGQLEALLDEGQVVAPEEDSDVLLEELTTAELVELTERLDGLSG